MLTTALIRGPCTSFSDEKLDELRGHGTCLWSYEKHSQGGGHWLSSYPTTEWKETGVFPHPFWGLPNRLRFGMDPGGTCLSFSSIGPSHRRRSELPKVTTSPGQPQSDTLRAV